MPHAVAASVRGSVAWSDKINKVKRINSTQKKELEMQKQQLRAAVKAKCIKNK